MLQLLALTEFTAIAAITVTLIKVARTEGQPRLKMLLSALYSFELALYLNEFRGMDLADKHGLGSNEPLIFGTWQLPIEAGIALAILGLQIYFLLWVRSTQKKKLM